MNEAHRDIVRRALVGEGVKAPTSGEGVYYVIDRLGKEIGKRVRPHGLRHAAITEALDVTNGDIRKVRQFSRHKSMDMLIIYDDARKDFGGEIADLLTQR